MAKIGFYLGTFDPIHFGHLAFAKKALGIVSNVKISPHSDNPQAIKKHSSFDVRAHMVNLAVKDLDGIDLFVPSTNVYNSPNLPKFRFRAFQHFQEHFPEDEVYILVGSDRLANTMYQDANSELLRIPHIIGIRGVFSEDLERVISGFDKAEVVEVNSNMSSTLARACASNFDDLIGCVPQRVAEYILSNRLYVK